MRKHICTLVLVILTTSGCQSTPLGTPRDGSDLDRRDPLALLEQAAGERDPERAAVLRLDASRLLLRGGDAQAALAALDGLDGIANTELADAVRRQRALVLEALGDFAAARASLAQVRQLSVEDLLQTAELCGAIGDHRCAADGYIQAAEKSAFDATRLPPDINDLIWLHLSQAREGPRVFTHRYHHAWWLLQQEMRTADSVASQVAIWQRWQRANPSHPGRINPPAALAQLGTYTLPSVGVLVPLSGPLAGAGQALRDGLIAAYLADAGGAKPSIQFYDSNAADLGQLLERALLDGRNVLVGPLIKDDVERFAPIAAAAEIPTLLLNHRSEQAHGDGFVYELGIAIEDEAITLADVVLASGHEKVLVVHSNAAWSQRAMHQFTELWPYRSTRANFGDIKRLTEAVGESMQVAASQTRSDRLSRIIGAPLEFLPRARGDLDAVVALTNQIESRALIPALEFHYAANLPVYATSQSARGLELAELAGFTLTELPIFAAPTDTQAELVDVYGLAGNPLAELYALGFDAYKVATWLPLLDGQPGLALDGSTGLLRLLPSGRFARELRVNVVLENGTLAPAAR